MSDFWVLPRLFKASGLFISWSDEEGALGYRGPQQEHRGEDGNPHLRWLLHPSLGLPLEAFEVWRHREPERGMSTQELANLDDWELVEIVGLPVEDSRWEGTQYARDPQGPTWPSGVPSLSPVDAADERLNRGAPRIGWPVLDLGGGETLPEWQPPDLLAYREHTLESHLLHGIRLMLEDEPDPLRHASYYVTESESAQRGSLHPHIVEDLGAFGAVEQPAAGTWHPLGLMLLAAGTDPLASLMLGFGTALDDSGGESGDIFRVSVRHRFEVGGKGFELQLADVVFLEPYMRPPETPTGLGARLRGRTRPQVIDGPAIDTVAVEWDRVANPTFGFQPPDAPRPVSYALARYDHSEGRGQMLITPRPEEVDGFMAFVPSKPEENRPALFTDHLSRATELDGEVVGQTLESERTYGVAAQDIFGRFGRWETFRYVDEAEASQVPSVFAVRLELSGRIEVDFGWDWSSRSPQYVDLTGAWDDDAADTVFSVRIEFSGEQASAAGNVEVHPLSPELERADWGEAQDRPDSSPEVRFYRVRGEMDVDLSGAPRRAFSVRARGESRLSAELGGPGPSDFGPAVTTEVLDPERPAGPGGIPEAPQWASLPDTSGVSRAMLRWNGVAGVDGYVLYEATESALLAAANPQAGPDATTPYTTRLARLRGLDLSDMRRAFRRVQTDLIATTYREVTLPRGSTVIHMYAVTAMGRNGCESAWPAGSSGFFAVAAPRAPVPAPPWLEAHVVPDAGQPRVMVSIGVAGRPAVSAVELYRTTRDDLAASADTMGPPVGTFTPADGAVTYPDPAPHLPSWDRISYRAVGWSAADPQSGTVEARSPASNLASVIMPPAGPPALSDLRDEVVPSSTYVRVSWSCATAARNSPLGQHIVILEAPPFRLEGALHSLPVVGSVAEVPPPGPAAEIVRIGSPESYRLYAWVPRPEEGEVAELTAKVIDPLGRIGTSTLILWGPEPKPPAGGE